MKTPLVLGAIALTLTANLSFAQPPDGESGPGRKAPPVMAALDADHDRVISAEEIANASAALATLDKNGDGQLTEDEIRPEGRGEGGRPGKGQGKGESPRRGEDGRPGKGKDGEGPRQ